MGVRDRIVAALLAAGVLVGMAGWHAVSPLVGIAVVLAALVAACVVYRLDRAPRREPPLEERGPVSTRRSAERRP